MLKHGACSLHAFKGHTGSCQAPADAHLALDECAKQDRMIELLPVTKL